MACSGSARGKRKLGRDSKSIQRCWETEIIRSQSKPIGMGGTGGTLGVQSYLQQESGWGAWASLRA